MKFGAFQNIKEKLLRGGGAKLDNLALAAYGKMPLYKDYINLECNDGPAAEYKAWLDASFGLTFEEFGGRAVAMEGPKRLLWRLPGGKSFAVATLWPSHDEGGLRKFPISFFAAIPRGALQGKSVADGWMLLEQIWAALEAARVEAAAMKSIDEFYAAFRGRKIEAVDAGADGDAKVTVEEWIRALDPAAPESYAGRLTQNLAGLIEACREFADHGADLAVRLPLSPSIPLGAQVYVWERVFRENLKKCAPWPSIAMPWTVDEENKNLCLLWREIRKEDARLMGADLTGYDYVEDIAGEMLNPKGLYATRPMPATELAEDLGEWIAKLGKC